MALPTYDPSIVTVVQRVEQNNEAPRFVLGGQGTGNDYALFKKTNSLSTYSAASATFAPETLTGGATSLTLSDDEVSAAIALPFVFPFFGLDQTHIFIGSNGLIGFTSPGLDSYSVDVIPSTPTPNNAIYGFWTDLDPSTGGTITYQTIGTSPNRVFVIQYFEVPSVDTPSLKNTFQIHLLEADNSIEIHTTSASVDTANNESITQGLENADGSIAVVFSGRNQLGTLTLANDAVRFIPASGSGEYRFNAWRSPVYQIGHNFDVLEVKLPIPGGVTGGKEIIPVLYFDNESTSSVGTAINSTTFPNSEKPISLSAKSFGNSVHGRNNFFLELQFTGGDLCTVKLPIEIKLEVEDQT